MTAELNWSTLFSHLPPALQFPIELGNANERIMLYDGPLTCSQGDVNFETRGSVFLDWFPTPRFRFELAEVPIDLNLAELNLELQTGSRLSAQLTNINKSFGPQAERARASGFVQRILTQPKSNPIHRVLFVLPNFGELTGKPVDFGNGCSRPCRLLCTGSGWKITLDKTTNEEAVRTELKSRSGYGVTHIGVFEKDDGTEISLDESEQMLVAFAYYCSFAIGRWTGPSLAVCQNAHGAEVCQHWLPFRIAVYQFRQNWIHENHSSSFECAFPGFMELWLDDEWREVLSIAINCYIEANAQAGNAEGSIALTQTAFELLCSAILVEKMQWISSEGSDKLPAADRIRLLLCWAGIPTAIPLSLTSVVKQAKADNWRDGPEAFTNVRNATVHPTKKNRGKAKNLYGDVMYESWKLGLWYLELCLLRIFKFEGDYFNRTSNSKYAMLERVPWSNVNT